MSDSEDDSILSGEEQQSEQSDQEQEVGEDEQDDEKTVDFKDLVSFSLARVQMFKNNKMNFNFRA